MIDDQFQGIKQKINVGTVQQESCSEKVVDYFWLSSKVPKSIIRSKKEDTLYVPFDIIHTIIL